MTKNTINSTVDIMVGRHPSASKMRGSSKEKPMSPSKNLDTELIYETIVKSVLSRIPFIYTIKDHLKEKF